MMMVKTNQQNELLTSEQPNGPLQTRNKQDFENRQLQYSGMLGLWVTYVHQIIKKMIQKINHLVSDD